MNLFFSLHSHCQGNYSLQVLLLVFLYSIANPLFISYQLISSQYSQQSNKTIKVCIGVYIFKNMLCLLRLCCSFLFFFIYLKLYDSILLYYISLPVSILLVFLSLFFWFEIRYQKIHKKN